MKRIVLTTSLLLTLFLIQSKAESFKWAIKTGTTNGMCTDASDNLYATGAVPVIKYNSSGKEMMRINAAANDTVIGYAVAVDAQGNIYLSGGFSSELRFGNLAVISKGHLDAFWAKFRPDGTPVWLKSAGGTGYDECSAMDMDRHGNIYITGFFSTAATFGSYSLSGTDYREAFAMNCDSNGGIKWIQSINGTGANSDYIEAISISASNPGTCIITGLFGGTAVFAGTQYKAAGLYANAFMAVLTGFAKTAWVKTYESANINSAKQIKGGDIFACGSFTTATDIGNIHVKADTVATNILLVRFDSSGNPKWVQTAGSNYDDDAGNITLDSMNNIYVSGSYSDHAKFTNTYLASKGELDAFFAKYDQYGNRLWLLGLGDEGEDGGGFIGLNKAQNQLFVSGEMQFGNVDFGGTTLSDNNEFYFIASLQDINSSIPAFKTKNTDLEVYPNPAKSSFTLSMKDGFEANTLVSVYNVLGEEIQSTKPGNHENTIHFDHIPVGIYMVVVQSGNTVAQQKIVVQ